MATRETFWMVYGGGQGRPTYRHDRLDEAKAEATRLARLNPGVRFFVLEAIAAVEKIDVRVMDLRNGGTADLDNEIPF